jgi:glucitol operon activator protein
MRQFLPFFVVFAAVWALQLYATAKQGQRFMAAVGRLRAHGEVAIGASSHNRLRRRSYVALASDETDLVTAAIELDGLTVFASPAPVDALVGRPLRELADAPDGDRRSDAARMAARALLGEELHAATATAPGARTARAHQKASSSAGHLPTAANASGHRAGREGDS